jgi:hypothetical protein
VNDDDDEILASDRSDYSVEIADHCEWPGCTETKHLKLGASGYKFYVLCTRHSEALMNGEFELKEDAPTVGEA